MVGCNGNRRARRIWVEQALARRLFPLGVLENNAFTAYRLFMANKASSAPLFGSPTREEVEAIQNHMHDFTARLIRNADETRRLLEDIGALTPKGDRTDIAP